MINIMEKTDKKEIFTLGMKYYKRYFNDFLIHAENFKVIHDGSSILIEFNNKAWRFVDYGGVNGKGFHLCKFVKSDVEKYITENPNSEYIKDVKANKDLEIQKANEIGLKKYLGKQIYCLDVNNCYWETAFKMGFISKSTYLRGMKNKDWKTGRNASIGSLSKVVVASEYIKGIRQEPKIIEQETDLSPIRNAIVNHVHGLFLDILNKLGEDWLMYFTDCVYIPYEKIKEVQDFFISHGYETKLSTYQLDSYDEQGNVYWHDYQKNKAKIFKFNKRQFSLQPLPKFMFDVIPNTLKENKDFLKNNN